MASVTQIIRRRHRRLQRRAQTRTLRRNWTVVLLVLLALLLIVPAGIVVGSVGRVYLQGVALLPEPQETIYLDPVIGATRIYDNTGQTLLFAVEDPLGDERTWTEIDSLPRYVATATVLWEDPDFMQTAGFDLVGLFDRVWSNNLAGPIAADSSLTGRLVRNVILSSQELDLVTTRSLEAALIAEINRRYTPQEVIEWHLNTNYYGNEAYGIEAAAQVYLGKSAQDLTLDEAALLAALPTAPRFNPVDDETAARGRQGDVLRRMLAEGEITQSQFEQANNTFTAINPNAGQTPLIAPEFALYARQQAETLLTAQGLDGAQLVSRGGLEITTTLDLDYYLQGECALRAHVAQLDGQPTDAISALDGSPCYAAGYLPPVEATTDGPDRGALVMMNASTGEVLAMVGTATRPAYQPGPTLHPMVYLAGFLAPQPNNYTAATMLLDIPSQFPGAADGLLHIPNNVDEQFRGPMSLRDAMGAALLPPVTQVAHRLNLNNILNNIMPQMGVDDLRGGSYDLSLLDRGGSVSVLEMTYAYSVFASMGRGLLNHTPIAISRIEDADGGILWEYGAEEQATRRAPVLEERVAFLVNDILADATTRRETLGADNALELDRPAAVVNGITGDRLDNWTIGYTPQLVLGVHLGRGERLPMALPGFAEDGAAAAWRGLMDYAHLRDALPARDWARPETIVETSVCEISGLGPSGACDTRREIFLDPGQFPPEDSYWQTVEVNTQTEQLATFNTPVELVQERRYFVPPEEAMDWWQANNRPLPPTEVDTVSLPDLFSSAEILFPDRLAIVGGQVDVRGSIDTEGLDFYVLRYGEGPNPQSWIDLIEPQERFTPGSSLGTWDTTGLSGQNVLQLSVTRQDGTVDTSTVPVIVDNIPPTVILQAGEAGQTTFNWPSTQTIQVVAQVTENIRVDRVVFYHNGQEVGTDREAPYGYQHSINRPGTEIFSAVVYDSVGNQSQSVEIAVNVVRDGG